MGIHFVTSMNHKQCFLSGIPSPFNFEFLSTNQFQIKIHIDTQGFENIFSDWLAAYPGNQNASVKFLLMSITFKMLGLFLLCFPVTQAPGDICYYIRRDPGTERVAGHANTLHRLEEK